MAVRETLQTHLTGTPGTTVAGVFALLAVILVAAGLQSWRELQVAPDDLPHRDELLKGPARVPAILLCVDAVLLAMWAVAWDTVKWPVTSSFVVFALMLAQVGVLSAVRPWWIEGWLVCLQMRWRPPNPRAAWLSYVETTERVHRSSKWRLVPSFLAVGCIALIPLAGPIRWDREAMRQDRGDQIGARLEQRFAGSDVVDASAGLAGDRTEHGLLPNRAGLELRPDSTEADAEEKLGELRSACREMGLSGDWQLRVAYGEAETHEVIGGTAVSHASVERWCSF